MTYAGQYLKGEPKKIIGNSRNGYQVTPTAIRVLRGKLKFYGNTYGINEDTVDQYMKNFLETDLNLGDDYGYIVAGPLTQEKISAVIRWMEDYQTIPFGVDYTPPLDQEET